MDEPRKNGAGTVSGHVSIEVGRRAKLDRIQAAQQDICMKKAALLDAPRIGSPPAADKWEREYRAFLRLRRSLLRTHKNQYVAVHQGKVVDSGDDEIVLGLRVYAKFGYVPIYVGLVSGSLHPVVRIPSQRLKRTDP